MTATEYQDRRETTPERAALAVQVVVVTYNSERHVGGLLADLAPLVERGLAHVTIVDNGSTDRTVELLRATPWVHLLLAPHNPGYAAGINLGRSAGPDGVPLLVLNPDVRLRPGAVDLMLAAVGQPGVGVAVPTLQEEDGEIYPSLRREPSLSAAVGDALFGDAFAGRPARFSEAVRNPADYARSQDVDWATGAALVISAECAAAVGTWDEQLFFMYSEETDFCRRARAAGFRIRYAPEAVAVHARGGSGSSPELDALMAVNKVRYYRKHHGRGAALAFRLVNVAHALARPHRPGHRAALLALLVPGRARRLPGARGGRL